MKKLWILILFVVFPLSLVAQQQVEYNKKGDDAMKRLDYSDAKMWYEEGVSSCDPYSIKQLTTIWLNKERMRPSMRSLMNKCLNCLNVMATESDTTAIDQLISYYTEGIGTPKSEELATYWAERLTVLRKPIEPIHREPIEPSHKSSHKRMEFFAGYSYSIESPYGITLGGVAQKFGWYARFKTNMAFTDFSYECNKGSEIINFPNAKTESYRLNKEKSRKKNSFVGTAGLVVKCTPWLYTSVGLGYGERTLLYPFTVYDLVETSNPDKQREVWCKNIDASYKGVAADLDVMVKVGSFFVSAGCNTINFKYIDLNAGLGVFF